MIQLSGFTSSQPSYQLPGTSASTVNASHCPGTLAQPSSPKIDIVCYINPLKPEGPWKLGVHVLLTSSSFKPIRGKNKDVCRGFNAAKSILRRIYLKTRSLVCKGLFLWTVKANNQRKNCYNGIMFCLPKITWIHFMIRGFMACHEYKLNLHFPMFLGPWVATRPSYC